MGVAEIDGHLGEHILGNPCIQCYTTGYLYPLSHKSVLLFKEKMALSVSVTIAQRIP
jgi:hypothetical protein